MNGCKHGPLAGVCPSCGFDPGRWSEDTFKVAVKMHDGAGVAFDADMTDEIGLLIHRTRRAALLEAAEKAEAIGDCFWSDKDLSAWLRSLAEEEK